MLSLRSPAPSRVARYSAVITLAALAACANDAPASRLLAPASPSLGKTAGGSTQRILFASNIDAINSSYTLDVYSMNPDGTGITRLTNSPAFDGEARWSPDGKRIAFSSNRDKAGSDIYVMNADGSHVTRLTSDPGFFESPTWSKDGKQIAFVSTRDAADPTAFNEADYEIYVMNADGTNIVRLTNNSVPDGYPAWSADGRQIAFVSGRDHVGTGGTDLYVMNPDGSNVVRLTTQAGLLETPSWDPHSRRIAFSVNTDSPETGLFTIGADGSGLTRLTFGGWNQDTNPSWSPDGTQLAYICSSGGHGDICLINADGTGVVKITNGAAQHVAVSWSR